MRAQDDSTGRTISGRAQRPRVALLGAGDHGLQSHVRPLAQIAEIVAVADPDPAAAGRVAAVVGAPVPAVPTDELWELDADLVIVASPDRFHLDAVISAVDSGTAAMVEKPLACSVAELDVLDAALARRGTTMVTTCHPRRFDPPVRWYAEAREQLIDELGEVVTVGFDFSYHEPSKTGLHTGLLADHVSHETDLVNFLFGRSGATLLRVCDTEVRYEVAGLRDDGISVHFAGTRMLPSRRYPEWLTVRHSRGAVHLDLSTGVATVRDDTTGTSRQTVCGATDYPVRFMGLAAHLVASATGLEAPYLDDADLRFGAAVGAHLTEAPSVNMGADGRVR